MTAIKGPGGPNQPNLLPEIPGTQKPVGPTTISGEVALNNAVSGQNAVEQLGARVGRGTETTVSLAGPLNDPFVGQANTGFISGLFDASSMPSVAAPLVGGVPDPSATDLPMLPEGITQEAKTGEVGRTYRVAVSDHFEKLAERLEPQVNTALRVINDPTFSTPGSPGNVALNAAQVAAVQTARSQGSTRLGSGAPGTVAANLDQVKEAGETVVGILKKAPGTAFQGIDFNNMDINDAIVLMCFLLAKDATLDLKDLLKDMNATRLKRSALRDGITKLKGWLATEKDKARKWFELNSGKLKPGTTFEDYFKSLKLKPPSVTFNYSAGTASLSGGSSVNPADYPASLNAPPTSGSDSTGPTDPPADPPANDGPGPSDGAGGASDSRMVSSSGGTRSVGGGGGGGGGGVGGVGGGGGVSKGGGVSGGGGVSRSGGAGGGGGGGGVGGVGGATRSASAGRSGGVSAAGGASSADGASASGGGANTRMGSNEPETETLLISGESSDTFDASLAKLSDQKESLAEMGEEQQLKMQMYMDRMQKANSMASNIMKKSSEIQSQIIGNFK
jgi:hypothetical protein